MEKAFRIRQANERKKNDEAAASLDAIRKRFDAREENADKVIARRVEDLIKGLDLSWLSDVDRIANEQTQLAAEKAGKSAITQGVQLEVVPELGTIVVRGSKDDVKRVTDVLSELYLSSVASDEANENAGHKNKKRN